MFAGMSSQILGEKFDIQRNNIWIDNRQTMSTSSEDFHDLESPGKRLARGNTLCWEDILKRSK